MPCRDYMDDFRPSSEVPELKERLNKLSRIACKALEEIEKLNDGSLTAMILQDPEVAEWWTAHKEADRKARQAEARKKAAAEEKARLEKVRKETLASLTPEQIKALGIKV